MRLNRILFAPVSKLVSSRFDSLNVLCKRTFSLNNPRYPRQLGLSNSTKGNWYSWRRRGRVWTTNSSWKFAYIPKSLFDLYLLTSVMGAFLDKSKTDKHYESGSGNGVRYALCSMQGWRIDMEDSHVALSSMGAPFDSWSFFGVFDGHAGARVSKFCSENLVRYVTETEEFSQLKDENLSPEKRRDLIKHGLIRGFLNLDEYMRKLPDVVAGEDRSGSTAICALVTPDTIYLANCGDSRGLIVSHESVAVATFDHKPVNPIEKERIQKAGGNVMIQRVNGSLAVSRALGDFEYKRVPELGPFEQLISPEPEISDWGRSPDDEFIVLACDGVWDVMTNDDVCQFVRYQLTATDNLEKICEGLVDNCLNKGSRDNISVVLIALPGAPHISEEAKLQEEALDRSIENAAREILLEQSDKSEMDFTTLSHLVGQKLDKAGVTFPSGSGINAKRSVMEKAWKEIHPDRELNQEPGRPMMGFFRPKNPPPPPAGPQARDPPGPQSPLDQAAHAKLPDDDDNIDDLKPDFDSIAEQCKEFLLMSDIEEPPRDRDPNFPVLPITTTAVDAPEH